MPDLTMRRPGLPGAILVVLVVTLLFLQAPHGGAFYWSDAPRHALNGVFVKDLLADLPLTDPAGYAYRYYAQYPALTILFYPPLFYALSAPFYALLGVSHGVALLVVFLHYAAFGLGCLALARQWLPAGAALAFALLMVLLPEVAFWGRQVMLEVPAFAFLVWSLVAFVAYLRGRGPAWLYGALALLVAAMYTKISVGFVAPLYLLLLLQRDGPAALWRRHHLIAAALAALALVPLVVLTLRFGQANVQSVTGVADAVASRHSLAGWLWYLRQLPLQLGWPLLVAALAGLVLALCRPARLQALPGGRAGLAFWAGLFVLGYVFFSLIDLKEARHSVFLLPAVVFVAVLGPQLWLPRPWAGLVLAALVLATAATTVWLRPVYYVQGYDRAVAYVAAHAPRDSAVLFSGYRDGSFIFNMRAREDRRDLSVVRADKLLLSVAVRRELGVTEKGLTEAELTERINASGVHYVVMQPGFWTDLEAMRRFERVVTGPGFELVARIPTPANHRAHETELRIYRNLGPVAPRPSGSDIELRIINRQIATP